MTKIVSKSIGNETLQRPDTATTPAVFAVGILLLEHNNVTAPPVLSLWDTIRDQTFWGVRSYVLTFWAQEVKCFGCGLCLAEVSVA